MCSLQDVLNAAEPFRTTSFLMLLDALEFFYVIFIFVYVFHLLN